MEVDNVKSTYLDFEKIPLDDYQCYEQFSKGNTIGVFQFSGYGITQFLKDMRPNRFEDLIIANALYRPGPLNSGIVETFLKRKKGERYEIHEKLSNV